MLTVNVFFPNPTPSQYETFKIVLALAAAGIGGILTGFINIEGTFQKVVFRSGGALALFLIIYFFSPTAPIHPVIINQTQEGGTGMQIGVNKGMIYIGTKDDTHKDVKR